MSRELIIRMEENDKVLLFWGVKSHVIATDAFIARHVFVNVFVSSELRSLPCHPKNELLSPENYVFLLFLRLQLYNFT